MAPSGIQAPRRAAAPTGAAAAVAAAAPLPPPAARAAARGQAPPAAPCPPPPGARPRALHCQSCPRLLLLCSCSCGAGGSRCRRRGGCGCGCCGCGGRRLAQRCTQATRRRSSRAFAAAAAAAPAVLRARCSQLGAAALRLLRHVAVQARGTCARSLRAAVRAPSRGASAAGTVQRARPVQRECLRWLPGGRGRGAWRAPALARARRAPRGRRAAARRAGPGAGQAGAGRASASARKARGGPRARAGRACGALSRTDRCVCARCSSCWCSLACSFAAQLLGETAVGKSSLALRFARDQFLEYQESTIGAAFLTQSVIVDGNTIKFEIWDTAGQERYHSLAPMVRLSRVCTRKQGPLASCAPST